MTINSLNQITQAGDVSYTWDNAGNLVSQSRNGVIAQHILNIPFKTWIDNDQGWIATVDVLKNNMDFYKSLS